MDICDVFSIAPHCVAGDVMSAATSTVFDGLAGAFAGAVEAVLDATFDAISATTMIDLSADHVGRNIAVLTSVALVLVAGLFVIQVVSAVFRQEFAGLVRAVTGAGAAILGTAASVAVIQSLLIVVDGICETVASAAGTSIEEAARKLLDVGLLTSLAGPGVGAILVILFGGLYIVGAVLTLGTLVVRGALIMVAVVVAPIAIAGGTARVTSGWVRRWVQVTLALILSKLAIVIVFVVAVGMVGGATGIGALLSGLILILLACFAPWACFKFLDFAGTQIAGEMQRVATAGTHAAVNQGKAAARTIMRVAAPVVGGATGAAASVAASSAGARTAQGAPPIPGSRLFDATTSTNPGPGTETARGAARGAGGVQPSPSFSVTPNRTEAAVPSLPASSSPRTTQTSAPTVTRSTP